MRLFRFFLPLFALLIMSPAASAPPAPTADWTGTMAVAADGAHVYGDPAAPLKLIVYVSYTCSHCAHFEQQGMGALMTGWVRTGKVSLTIRNLVRDRYDLTAALLARCGAPSQFLGNHHALFGWQDAWFDRLGSYERAPSKLPDTASRAAIMIDIASHSGLYQLMGKRGFSPARLGACLSDEAGMKQVLAMTQDGLNKVGITGTPSFVINGALTQAHDWDSLRALLPGGLPATTT